MLGPVSAVKYLVPRQALGDMKVEFKSFLPAYPLVTHFASTISSQFSVLFMVFDKSSLIIPFLYNSFSMASFDKGSKHYLGNYSLSLTS